MKKIFTIIVFLIMVQWVNAQSHVPKSQYHLYNCRFAPKGSNNSEGKSMCPACAKENEDARQKTIADDKAAYAAGKIRNEKLKAESAIAFKKNLAEVAAKNRVTEVHVTMGKTPAATNKAPAATKTKAKVISKPTKDVLLIADYPGSMSMNGHQYNYFLNGAGDTVLKSKDYYATYASWDDNKNNFPKNVGIVVFNQENTLTNGKTRKVVDLVDLKGKRYFNDPSISTIFHLRDDYFVVGRSKDFGEDSSWGYNYRRFQYAEIYNHKTKKIINIERERSRVELYITFDRKKFEDEGLKPMLMRSYSDGVREVFCLDTNGELVTRKY